MAGAMEKFRVSSAVATPGEKMFQILRFGPEVHTSGLAASWVLLVAHNCRLNRIQFRQSCKDLDGWRGPLLPPHPRPASKAPRGPNIELLVFQARRDPRGHGPCRHAVCSEEARWGLQGLERSVIPDGSRGEAVPDGRARGGSVADARGGLQRPTPRHLLTPHVREGVFY